ncbi:hypothetical protein BK022_00840 [Methylorubrum extorquens]|uniref:Uncharacterized protein n=1 Tax=Methylorubrum extorquens TaxID=408 RepID=A0A1S1P956_METEX|nr:hypothetical protein BK022_00840 [Methylorubrum extorquens]
MTLGSREWRDLLNEFIAGLCIDRVPGKRTAEASGVKRRPSEMASCLMMCAADPEASGIARTPSMRA